jgi:alkylation response protein AidB-like acyl-CoA dehydrogenase
VAAARIRQAAFLIGVAARSLEVARDHTHRRQQFGRALVAFQTVSHRLAALLAEGDGWMLLLQEAAWQHDCGKDATRSAAEILAASAEHALQASRLAVQLHGVRGMLAHSIPATAYRIAAAEGVRLGTPRWLWLEVGRGRLAEHAPTAPTVSSGGYSSTLRL